jgi:surface carbohydrate biosynthesis protein
LKKILIIVDHPQRDLLGSVYLAEELVKNNFIVILTQMYNFHEVFLFNPDLVIVNHGRIKKFQSSGIDIVIEYCQISRAKLIVIDNEGGTLGNKQVKGYQKTLNTSIKFVDKYFLWGENKTSLIKKESDKYLVTGHPRFDPYFIKNFKNKFLLNFKKRNYILVNTSFAVLNPLEGDKHGIEGLKKYQNTSVYCDHKLIFDRFISFIRYFAKKYPKVSFVLRPHPFESEKFYKNEFKNYSNIDVLSEGDIFFYLKYCKFCIVSDCQTSLESILAKKNCINFKKYGNEFNLLDQISLKAENEIDLERIIKKLLKNNQVYNLNKKMKIVSKYYNNVNDSSSKIITQSIVNLFKGQTKEIINIPFCKIIKIYFNKRSTIETIKFILKIIFGTNLVFYLKSLYANDIYRKKNFKVKQVLELLSIKHEDKLYVKKSTVLDLYYKYLIFPQSIILKK